MRSKFRKALSLLARPSYISAALLHRVAAATEHQHVIRQCAASSLIDVGANKGQFSLAFRALCPDAPIVAFEPLAEAGAIYDRLFSDERNITLQRVALGVSEGQAQFHVANRDDSSSLLKPGSGQEDAFGVHGTRMIEVPVKRLDTTIDLASLPHPILLKIDVQGGELAVLQGCDTLDMIDFIYVELSFVELYEGQPLFDDVAKYLGGRGFEVVGTFNPVDTKAFGPTQADFLFRRRSHSRSGSPTPQ